MTCPDKHVYFAPLLHCVETLYFLRTVTINNIRFYFTESVFVVRLCFIRTKHVLKDPFVLLELLLLVSLILLLGKVNSSTKPSKSRKEVEIRKSGSLHTQTSVRARACVCVFGSGGQRPFLEVDRGGTGYMTSTGTWVVPRPHVSGYPLPRTRPGRLGLWSVTSRPGPPVARKEPDG